MLSIKHHIEIELGGKTAKAVNRFLDIAERFVAALENSCKPTLKGGGIMFIVKDDNQDVNYFIEAPEVRDSEGELISDAELDYEVSSSDPDVVSITAGPEGAKAGIVHFGKPGQAAINVNVKFGDTLLGAFGGQFTVTAGDPAAITGGGINFGGLTES